MRLAGVGANHLLELGARIEERLFDLGAHRARRGDALERLVGVGFGRLAPAHQFLDQRAQFLVPVDVGARQRQQHRVAAIVDIGLDGVERENLGARQQAGRSGVQHSGGAVDLVGALVPVEQHLTHGHGRLPARTPDLVVLDVEAVGPVDVLAADIGVQIHGRQQRALRGAQLVGAGAASGTRGRDLGMRLHGARDGLAQRHRGRLAGTGEDHAGDRQKGSNNNRGKGMVRGKGTIRAWGKIF